MTASCSRVNLPKRSLKAKKCWLGEAKEAEARVGKQEPSANGGKDGGAPLMVRCPFADLSNRGLTLAVVNTQP